MPSRILAQITSDPGEIDSPNFVDESRVNEYKTLFGILISLSTSITYMYTYIKKKRVDSTYGLSNVCVLFLHVCELMLHTCIHL